MREDGRRESPVSERFKWYSHGGSPPKDLRGLSIISTIYSLTEIFEFAIRLAKHGALSLGARIQLELFGLTNRMLFFEDFGRDLYGAYICRDGNIKKEALFPSPEELIEKGHSVALDWFIEIAHQFQWDSPPRGLFKEEQQKFLERRI
jgi:hypothetical protein